MEESYSGDGMQKSSILFDRNGFGFFEYNQPLQPFLVHPLVGGFNPIWKKNSQIGSLPQIGVKIKNVWNHHLEHVQVPSKWRNPHLYKLSLRLMQGKNSPPKIILIRFRIFGDFRFQQKPVLHKHTLEQTGWKKKGKCWSFHRAMLDYWDWNPTWKTHCC